MGSIGLIGFFNWIFFYDLAFRKLHLFFFSIAYGCYFKKFRQGVHRFYPYPIHSYRFLECIGIIFSSRIHFCHTINDLFKWDATSVVSYTYLIIFDGNIDYFTDSHHKFINGIVNYFFHQNINSIVLGRSFSQFSNIHARSLPDMFIPFKGFYVFFCI